MNPDALSIKPIYTLSFEPQNHFEISLEPYFLKPTKPKNIHVSKISLNLLVKAITLLKKEKK